MTLEVSRENSIRAIVTNQAVEELGLVEGRRAVALVKSSFITLEPIDEATEAGARNRFVAGRQGRRGVQAVTRDPRR